MNLRQKAFSGIIWNSIEHFSLTFIHTVINIAIARKLAPSDYGLIAIVTVFIHFSDVLVNSGLKSALVRKPDLCKEDLTTTFLFNLFAAIFIYISFFFSAPFISLFYDMPRFTFIARILAIVIILNSLCMVQNALVTRNINFKFMAKINISANLIGGVLGLASAYSGFGVWSLIIQTMTKSFVTTVLFWIKTTWSPSFLFKKSIFWENFKFGYKLLLSGLISSAFNNLYYLVIGKVYSADNLGYYHQGKRLGELSSQTFYLLFQRTSFPVLSSIQNEEQRFRHVYIQLLRLLAFVSFPIAFLLIGIGKSLILLLLTDKWAPAIPFFYILCFSGMFFPITGVTAYAILAKGRSDLFLKLEILLKVLMVLMISATFRCGILWMVAGQAFLMIVQFIINVLISGKVIGIEFIKHISSIIPSLLLSVMAFLSIYLVSFANFNNTCLLFIQIILFTFIYIGLACLLKIKEYYSIRVLAFEKLSKSRSV